MWSGNDTALHRAAAGGDTAIITELLRYNPPLEHCGMNMRTPLLEAAFHAQEAAVDLLLAAGSDPEALDDTDTLLELAIESNLTQVAVAHIRQMNAKALHCAIEHQRLTITKLMFAHGISNTVTLPLQFAVCSGLTYVKLCIEHGALEYIDSVDEYGTIALAVAEFRGDTDIVHYLLDQGADVNAGAQMSMRVRGCQCGCIERRPNHECAVLNAN